jgi:hypothetical protein
VNCPYCGKAAEWRENSCVYGRNYGDSYMIWICFNCDAYCGCHQNTQTPLGTMANGELREWRQKAHKAIDPIWKNGEMTRPQVYTALQKHFGREIHVGESDIETCKLIIEWSILR